MYDNVKIATQKEILDFIKEDDGFVRRFLYDMGDWNNIPPYNIESAVTYSLDDLFKIINCCFVVLKDETDNLLFVDKRGIQRINKPVRRINYYIEDNSDIDDELYESIYF